MYVGGEARYFTEVFSVQDLNEAMSFAKSQNLKIFILGGGSNIIVSDKGFTGLVIRVCIKGNKITNENSEKAEINMGAGESWDNFVKYAVENELYGIENMSHIPGTVGASVVQNIGCYGQEVSNSVVSVEVLDLTNLNILNIKNSEMEFSYRRSILNDVDKKKGMYVVVSVNFSLSKKEDYNLKYDDIKKYFEKNIDKKINLKNIREAVIEIRNKKYPFPGQPKDGTVGSFWNSEVVTSEVYENIIKKLQQKGFKDKAEDMVNKKSVFTVKQGLKVPYGMLIETLGFKGRIVGGAMILKSHSGVINNFTGTAETRDVLELSKIVIDAVWDEYKIVLKMEPEFVE